MNTMISMKISQEMGPGGGGAWNVLVLVLVFGIVFILAP